MTGLRRILVWTALLVLMVVAVATSAQAVGLANLAPPVPRSQCCCCVIPLGLATVATFGVVRKRRIPTE